MGVSILKPSLPNLGYTERTAPVKYIVVHHTASTKDFTPEEINSMHIRQGMNGIGYHLYIRKDGSVYQGRPFEMVGAHAEGYNWESVGVCLSGNFEIEEPTRKEVESLGECLSMLKGMFPSASIIPHSNLNATACPGKNLLKRLGRIITSLSTPPEKPKSRVKVFAHDGKIGLAFGGVEWRISEAFSVSLRNADGGERLLRFVPSDGGVCKVESDGKVVSLSASPWSLEAAEE